MGVGAVTVTTAATVVPESLVTTGGVLVDVVVTTSGQRINQHLMQARIQNVLGSTYPRW